MRAWTENASTQAEVKVFILDSLWHSLPRPPFTDVETEMLADKVYEHVWQRSLAS
jgi:type I restriction enzyme R subunit